MLSLAYLAKKNKEKYGNSQDVTPYFFQIFNPVGQATATVFTEIFLIYLVFDILVISIAIYFLFKLKIKLPYIILLIILFLIPGIGLLFQLLVIFYYLFLRHV